MYFILSAYWCFCFSQAEDKLKHEGDTDAETNRCRSEKEKIPAAQPFIQAPHRQSVIVFSSGQKLLAQNGAQTPSIQASQPAAQLQPCADQTSRSQSELNSETDRPVTPGKLCKTKGKVKFGELSIIKDCFLLLRACVSVYGLCCSF